MTSKKTMQKIADQVKGSYSKEFQVITGKEGPYTYFIKDVAQSGGYMTVHFGIAKGDAEIDRAALKQLSKDHKMIGNSQVLGNQVVFDLKASVFTKALEEKVAEALKVVTTFFAEQGYANVDMLTGEPAQTDLYRISDRLVLTTEENYEASVSEIESVKQSLKSENIISGSLGAVIGAVLGGIVIVLIGQLGFISVLAGIIMGYLTVKGYSLLGHQLSSWKGIVIISLVIIIMVFLSHQVMIAMSVADYWSVPLLDVLFSLPSLLKEGYIDTNIYYVELAKLYLFSLLGAVPTIINQYKNSKLQYNSEKID
ncbi:hypothetical protein AAK938_07120 [Aerococcaceae bacterium 50-4]